MFMIEPRSLLRLMKRSYAIRKCPYPDSEGRSPFATTRDVDSRLTLLGGGGDAALRP